MRPAYLYREGQGDELERFGPEASPVTTDAELFDVTRRLPVGVFFWMMDADLDPHTHDPRYHGRLMQRVESW